MKQRLLCISLLVASQNTSYEGHTLLKQIRMSARTYKYDLLNFTTMIKFIGQQKLTADMALNGASFAITAPCLLLVDSYRIDQIKLNAPNL
ncbi:hypothetical protein [Methylobacillus sp.]|uniref:hypothetical protein n=1 Tax=Methylobacillus sp. TaxID=56818 RepID=UPI002FDFC86A